jgi:hypothetical protein
MHGDWVVHMIEDRTSTGLHDSHLPDNDMSIQPHHLGLLSSLPCSYMNRFSLSHSAKKKQLGKDQVLFLVRLALTVLRLVTCFVGQRFGK